MGIDPAPSVLGGLSLTAAVELVCAVNLVVCVVVISQVSSVSAVAVGGITISPTAQCVTAAYFLLGVPVIIHGGVGAIYRVESHLKAYATYLLGCLAVVALWIAAFVNYGNTCATLQPDHAGSSSASFVCGISNGFVVFLMLAMFGLVAGAAYLVWSMAEYTKRRTETELIRYQEPFQVIHQMADDIALERGAGMQSAYQTKFAPPMPHRGGGQQFPQF